MPGGLTDLIASRNSTRQAEARDQVCGRYKGNNVLLRTVVTREDMVRKYAD